MNWNEFKLLHNTLLPNEAHASDDDWDDYEAVNDPASGKKLPNEGHAAEDDWDDYEAVNDPASGKKLPNEGHASDDDWDDYEAVNDPASGKKLPNEGHATTLTGRLMESVGLSAAPTSQSIFVTENFVKNISEIYGSFSPKDDEYPAMGITIQGAPVFVECLRFPDCAVVRRRATDEVKREHPAVGAIWQEKLREHDGKCRTSTVHIHPMNFPSLSGTDISNFDSLRLNPDDPSTFDGEHPYPVVLINLTGSGKLEMLGFWVSDGRAHQVDVQPIRDDSSVVKQAWRRAKKMPFFTEEGNIARRINQRVSKDWNVELGINPRTGDKAIKALRRDGKKVLVRFNSETPLGLSVGGATPRGFCFEDYFDWTRLFDDLAGRKESSPETQANCPKRNANRAGESASTNTAVEAPLASVGSPKEEAGQAQNMTSSVTNTRGAGVNNGMAGHVSGSRYSTTA